MGGRQAEMLIGFDFDNTIACYDQAISRLADELFDLPSYVPRTKAGLRDYLRQQRRETEWTAFQGELYGPGMRYAEPFEGAIETMAQLKACAHEMVIVSHRTPKPYAGSPHDLHQAAREWIETRLRKNGLFADDQIYFLETRDAKVAKINQLGCNVFLDDLPEVLESPEFPVETLGILFNPMCIEGPEVAKRVTISRWHQLPILLN
jgi:phosphoserine phosphatase